MARYFKQEKADLDKAEADLATATQSLEEMQEEHGGDEGLLSDLMNEKGKIPKGAVADRLKEIKKDREADEERKVLTAYLESVENESAAGSTVKELQKALDHKVVARYTKGSPKTRSKRSLSRTNGSPPSQQRSRPSWTAYPRHWPDGSGSWPNGTLLRCRNLRRRPGLSAKVDGHLKTMGFLR